MSVEAFSWALSVPIGGSQKVMLLGLANHAHPDGTHTYPSYDRLATYGACDRSTAKRNVLKLEEAGWIIRDGLGPEGQNRWRLLMGEAPVPPVQPAPPGQPRPKGGAPVPPEPSLEPSRKEVESASGRKVDLPEDFPDELRPHLKAVFVKLRDTARPNPKAREPSPVALAHVLMDRARRPLVAAAGDYAAWCAQNGHPHRDVVSGFRNWLDRDRAPDLPALERLDDAGRPARGTGSLPQGVTPIRNQTAAEREKAAKDWRTRQRLGLPPAGQG